ncbi:hypothetical protein FKP32DRAFT_891819 [Trametes sanguinea]|nr:hypothetical protein FKP32DRAFT_891819 [Trametes sanguinea]
MGYTGRLSAPSTASDVILICGIAVLTLAFRSRGERLVLCMGVSHYNFRHKSLKAIISATISEQEAIRMIASASYCHILGDGPLLGNAASVAVAILIRQTRHAGMVSVPGERTHLAVLLPSSLAGALGPSWETGYKQRGRAVRQLSPLPSRLALTAIAPVCSLAGR